MIDIHYIQLLAHAHSCIDRIDWSISGDTVYIDAVSTEAYLIGTIVSFKSVSILICNWKKGRKRELISSGGSRVFFGQPPPPLSLSLSRISSPHSPPLSRWSSTHKGSSFSHSLSAVTILTPESLPFHSLSMTKNDLKIENDCTEWITGANKY